MENSQSPAPASVDAPVAPRPIVDVVAPPATNTEATTETQTQPPAETAVDGGTTTTETTTSRDVSAPPIEEKKAQAHPARNSSVGIIIAAILVVTGLCVVALLAYLRS